MSWASEVNNSELRTQNSELTEPALRYRLGGGTIGTPSLALYGRTLVGAALWLGAPPLLAGLLGRLGARGAMHAIERWWARRMVSHLRIRLDLAGLDQIERHERYVVAPLHEGFADALALFHLPLDLRFVARDELFTWRFLGRYLRTTRQIEITPEQGARGYRQLLRGARDAFAAGESVVVFPQGTILGIESEFMAGAFALARALERPILPIALTGSHRVWEHPYTPRLRYGQRMSLRVLPPVAVKRNQEQSVDALRIDIRRRLKAAALDGVMTPPRHFVPARDGYWDGYAFQIDPDFPQLAEEIERHRGEAPDAQYAAGA